MAYNQQPGYYPAPPAQHHTTHGSNVVVVQAQPSQPQASQVLFVNVSLETCLSRQIGIVTFTVFHTHSPLHIYTQHYRWCRLRMSRRTPPTTVSIASSRSSVRGGSSSGFACAVYAGARPASSLQSAVSVDPF